MGALRKLLRGSGPGRERPVQAEPVSNHHVAHGHHSAEIGNEPAEELVKLAFIDGHNEPPVMVSP
jgi:hypothetical protein